METDREIISMVMHSPPSADSRRGVVEVLVKHLVKLAQEKSVVR